MHYYLKSILFLPMVLIATIGYAADSIPERQRGVMADAILMNKKSFLGAGEEYIYEAIKNALEKEGILTIEVENKFAVRDTFIQTVDNKLLKMTALNPEIFAKVVARLQKREEFLRNNSASFASKHTNLFAAFPKISSTDSLEDNDLAMPSQSSSASEAQVEKKSLFTPSDWRKSRSCLNGGNVMIVKNRAGVKKVLIGEYLLTLTHHALRIKGFFKPLEGGPRVYESESGTFNDVIHEQFQKGEIPTIAQALAKKLNLSNRDFITIGKEMDAMGLLDNFRPENGAGPDLKTVALEYVGQKEYIKTILWPYEFNTARENIVIVPQANTQLDLFLMESPTGVLVNDFDVASQFLETILKQSNHYKLTDTDIALLGEYQSNSQKIGLKLKPIYERIHQVLTQADINFTPFPGAFFTNCPFTLPKRIKVEVLGELQQKMHSIYLIGNFITPDIDKLTSQLNDEFLRHKVKFSQEAFYNQSHVNFMSSLLGWSFKHERPYGILLTVQAGNNLGKAMTTEISKVLRADQKLQVHFVGGGKKEISAARQFFVGKNLSVRSITWEFVKEHQSPSMMRSSAD